MFRIIYVSRNLIPEAEADAEVERILATARRRNAALGVTGALLFGEDAFAQALEGPTAAVEEVFEAIQADPRHAEVVVLEAGPVAAREFGDWQMAWAGRTAEAGARFAALAGAETRGGGGRVLSLLHWMVRRSSRVAAAA
jgi:FAD-dependent sensor of blue light